MALWILSPFDIPHSFRGCYSRRCAELRAPFLLHRASEKASVRDLTGLDVAEMQGLRAKEPNDNYSEGEDEGSDYHSGEEDKSQQSLTKERNEQFTTLVWSKPWTATPANNIDEFLATRFSDPLIVIFTEVRLYTWY